MSSQMQDDIVIRLLLSLLLLLLLLLHAQLVDTMEALFSFLQCTLAHKQQEKEEEGGAREGGTSLLQQYATEAVDKLVSLQYIITKPHPLGAGTQLTVTNMGRAVHKGNNEGFIEGAAQNPAIFSAVGCLDVGIANDVYQELFMSLNSLVLSSNLHLLFLTTPPDLVGSIEPNWAVYFDRVSMCIHTLDISRHVSNCNQ